MKIVFRATDSSSVARVNFRKFRFRKELFQSAIVRWMVLLIEDDADGNQSYQALFNHRNYMNVTLTITVGFLSSSAVFHYDYTKSLHIYTNVCSTKKKQWFQCKKHANHRKSSGRKRIWHSWELFMRVWMDISFACKNILILFGHHLCNYSHNCPYLIYMTAYGRWVNAKWYTI